jgi:hypothetical protein
MVMAKYSWQLTSTFRWDDRRGDTGFFFTTITSRRPLAIGLAGRTTLAFCSAVSSGTFLMSCALATIAVIVMNPGGFIQPSLVAGLQFIRQVLHV